MSRNDVCVHLVIGQFVSPDTIVPEPGRVFGYNRYMYTLGNPLNYTDPSGHCEETPDDDDAACWHALQRLLHSPSSAGIYTYDEAKSWDVNQIEMLIEFWSTNDFAQMDPDAHLIGVSGGFRLDTPLGFDASGRLSLEYLYNYVSGEHDLFVGGGGSLDFDVQNLLDVIRDPLRVFSGKPQLKVASAQGGVYLGDVLNLPENDLYRGRTTAQETALGFGPYSATSGSFQTPGDPNGPQGRYVGWTPSVGFNLGKSAVQMNSFRVRDIWNAAVDFVNGD